MLDKIEALERALHSPELRKSINLISDYIHDEFSESGLFCDGMTKDDIIEGLKSEDLSEHKIISEDYKLVEQCPNKVVIEYVSALENTLGERSYDALRQSIWYLCSDDKWRLIGHSANLL